MCSCAQPGEQVLSRPSLWIQRLSQCFARLALSRISIWIRIGGIVKKTKSAYTYTTR